MKQWLRPTLVIFGLAVLSPGHCLADAIHDAAAKGDLDKIQTLLRADPSLVNKPDTNGVTPLHFAARSGHETATKALLDAGADPEARNRDEHPPLYCALHNGKAVTARLLLERGATFDKPDRYGYLAIHQAARGASAELVEMLLAKGVPVDTVTASNSVTALLIAARDGKLEAISALLKHKANVNWASGDGATPLHWAASNGRLAAAKLLLAAGADANRRSKLGFKPLDLVKGRENDALAELLQQQTTTAWQETGVGTISESGDPALLDFRGNRAYTSTALRNGLALSASYLLAAHPQAQRRPFLEKLRQRVRSGYLHGGFPDPKVEVTFSETTGRARVDIVEGARFLCGSVTVTGVRRSLASAITDRLTKYQRRAPDYSMISMPGKSFPPEGGNNATDDGGITFGDRLMAAEPAARSDGQPPPWRTGQPANFDLSGRETIEAVTKACLLQKGFLFPKIDVQIEPDLRTGKASLAVAVRDRGPSGTVVDIEVTGNQKNTRAEILELVGLRSGRKLSTEILRQIDQRLWQSARFVSWSLMTRPAQGPESPRSGVALRIELEEYDGAPPLKEALSRQQRAVVKCADWIRNFEKRSEDLVINLANSEPGQFVVGRAGVIISPKDGALFEFEPGNSSERKCSLLVAKNIIALYPPGGAYNLQVQDPDLLTAAVIQLAPKSAGSSNHWNLFMGAMFRHIPDLASEGGATPPFQLNLSVPPAALLPAVSDFGGHAVLDGQNLVLRDPEDTNSILRINERTGKFEVNSARDGMQVRLGFAAGAFARARQQLEASGRNSPNRFDPRKPVSSMAGFAISQAMRIPRLGLLGTNVTPAQLEQASVALNKLLHTDILAPFDRAFEKDDREEKFTLPMDEIEKKLAQNNIAALMSGFAFRYGSELFPKYSWPWTIAREAVFVMAGQSEYTDAELNRLYASQETGPIGSLVLAKLLSRQNPKAAKSFALRGMTRLSSEDFLADCQLFLRGNCGLAASFANAADALRTLTEEDLKAIVAVLGPAEARLVTDAAQALKADPDKPLAITLAPALEQYWKDSLRAKVRAELQRLITGKSDREPSRA